MTIIYDASLPLVAGNSTHELASRQTPLEAIKLYLEDN